MRVALITFLVGSFAGLCSVFVPRIGGLLGVEDLTRVAIVFPVPFILLGAVYAAVIGGVVVILYHDERKQVTLRQKFITALGVPALIAGTLTTGAQTNEVRTLQKTNAELNRSLSATADLRRTDTPAEIVPLQPGPSGSLRLHELVGIGTAHAGGESITQRLSGYGAVKAPEPEYAIVLDRARDASEALSRARELKTQFPEAQAVRISGGFGVITGVKPESAAVLEAIRIKQQSDLKPELVRVK